MFHWSGKKFTGACSFEPDERGFLKFEQYLRSVVNVRTRFLVDVIEEDFRIEPVPHVYGKDKKAVIGRLLDRFYRASKQFTYAETIGRQKTGRRDDDVLLGAITNPKLLEPWLNIIEKCDVPMSGIWTLPLVSKGILAQLKANSKAVLLVSQQVANNLRQSFFKNKKLISSRTSVLNQDELQASKYGVLAEGEISRTLSYLKGQGHIDDNEVVEVHVLASRAQISSLEENLISSEYLQHYIHDVSSIENDVGISGLDGKHADGLFSWLCLKGIKVGGHYGSIQMFRQYYYSLASSALYIASIITLVFGVLVTESNIVESMEYSRSIDLLTEQKSTFNQTYNKKFKAFESVLGDAKVMDASVRLSKQIKDGSKVSPLDFFIELSKTLGSAKSGNVSIDKISWSTEQVLPANKNKKAETMDTNLVLNYPVQHVAIVTGRIPVSSENYRASVKRIESIIAVLKSNPRITDVIMLSAPVEVRSEKRFSADSGLNAAANKQDTGQGAFSLEIRMKAKDDA